MNSIIENIIWRLSILIENNPDLYGYVQEHVRTPEDLEEFIWEFTHSDEMPVLALEIVSAVDSFMDYTALFEALLDIIPMEDY